MISELLENQLIQICVRRRTTMIFHKSFIFFSWKCPRDGAPLEKYDQNSCSLFSVCDSVKPVLFCSKCPTSNSTKTSETAKGLWETFEFLENLSENIQITKIVEAILFATNRKRKCRSGNSRATAERQVSIQTSKGKKYEKMNFLE